MTSAHDPLEGDGPVRPDRPGIRVPAEYEALPDDALVSLAQQARPGDVRAFTALLLRHEQGVATNCRHMTGSVDDSRDLTQEVFVKAYFALERFGARSAFRTWLWRIKINHCLRFLEKVRGAAFVDLDALEIRQDAALQVQPKVTDWELSEVVATALDSLPDTLRVPVVLRDLDGFAYEEIAEQLGIGLSAVKMRIKRGREQLRAHLAAVEAELLPGPPAGFTPPKDRDSP